MRGSRTRKEMILHLQKMAKLARGKIDGSGWRLDSFMCTGPIKKRDIVTEVWV